jgi:exonuclease SbcD
MRVLLYSDLHAHPWKQYATILPDGMNSRLQDGINCLKQIIAFATTQNIDAVLFGGDLFHTRGRLSVQAFNAVFEAMAGFPRAVPQLLIHGNHDQADKEGAVYSIHTLRTLTNVVDKAGWVELETKNGETLAVMAVPYTENVAHLRELVREPLPPMAGRNKGLIPRILLGHLGVQGAKIGADFVYSNQHDAVIDDLNITGFDAVFLGHFHQHQQLAPNVWYIGAPMHHNWGDRHDPNRGFLIYDTRTRQVERGFLMAPQFCEMEEDQFLRAFNPHSGELDDAIVRIVTSKPWSEDTLRSYKEQTRARSFEAVTRVSDQTPVSKRVEITAGMSYPEILQRCIEEGVMPVEPGLDPDYLVQLGAEILAEVDNDNGA